MVTECPAALELEVGELCWALVSRRWGWGAGDEGEKLHVLWDHSRIWVADTKLHLRGLRGM